MHTIDRPAAGAPAAPAPHHLATEPLIESFRLLAVNLERLLHEEPRRVVEIVSAYPRDGRSLAAFALSRALAEIGRSVVLVNADPLGAGLREGAAAPLAAAGVSVLNPGHNGYESQVELLDGIRDQIELATSGGATVVLDTPACTLSSLPFRVAAWSTGILYVARRRPGDDNLHREIRAQLDLTGASVLGVVFNEG